MAEPRKRLRRGERQESIKVWIWPELLRTKLKNPTFGGSWVWAKKRTAYHVRATLTFDASAKKTGRK